MDPSDHDKNELGRGIAGGDDRPTHANRTPGKDGRWLRSVVENSSEIVTVVDPDGTLRYASPAFGRVLGHDPDEAIGTNVLDYVHPDDLPHVLEETEEALAKGGVATNKAEYRFRARDGSWRWMESVGTYLLDDPAVRGVVVVSRDVTKRKEAEEFLRRSETSLAESQRIAHLGTWERNLETDESWWSAETYRIYGFDPEPHAPPLRELMEVVHPEDRDQLEAAMRGALVEAQPYDAEHRIVLPNEKVRWVHRRAEVVRGADGKPLRIAGTVHDITERKEAEEAAHRSEERLRSLADAAFEGILISDEGEILEANRALTDMFGYSLAEVVGRTTLEFVAPEHRDLVRRKVASGDEEPYEAAGVRKDGTRLDLEVRGRAFSYRGRRVRVTAVRDVTERKAAEGRLREAEERYRTLVERIPAVTFVDRAEGPEEPVYVSPQVEEMLGYAPEEWMAGRLWRERLHPDDRERVLRSDERFDRDGEPVDEEYRLLAKDGRAVWVREETVLVRDEAGEPLFVQGILTDVTGRKEAERALRESEERFRGTFEDAPIGVALVGLHSPSPEADRRYLRVNPALCEMLGYAEEELLSMTTSDVTHPEDLERSRARMGQLFEEGGSKYTLEKRYVRKDGRVVWAMLNVSLVRDADGNPSHFVAQFQDVTERRALEDRLRHQALHDSLTGLPNRNLLVDRLGHALSRTERRRGGRAAVLFMDLDGFKVVNDSIGHDAGDLLLVAVAERLEGCLRPEDTLARFGGDEFVVLIEEVKDPAEAVRVAERISEGFGSPFWLGERELYARASIGIATGDARTKTPEALLRDADTAMYRAKEAGGGGYEMFDPTMHQRALGRLELENDLRRAVEEDEFVVHYQPIVSLQTGELWGMEALVRWEHPERGLLNPDEFVPVAEESGLVVPMGEAVLEEACRQAVAWQRELPRTPPLAVSVNLSGRQLRRPDLQDVIRRALEGSGLSASSLGLDITETVYISALDANTAALDRIKALGVRVSLDDFGSGYSSLSYLKRLPADILKVDKSFTRGLGLEIEDTAVVQTVVDLAHILGMEVVAEGVEIAEQETLLKEMGCDFGQGFHFSRPLPPEEASEFLRSVFRSLSQREDSDSFSDSD